MCLCNIHLWWESQSRTSNVLGFVSLKYCGDWVILPVQVRYAPKDSTYRVGAMYPHIWSDLGFKLHSRMLSPRSECEYYSDNLPPIRFLNVVDPFRFFGMLTDKCLVLLSDSSSQSTCARQHIRHWENRKPVGGTQVWLIEDVKRKDIIGKKQGQFTCTIFAKFTVCIDLNWMQLTFSSFIWHLYHAIKVHKESRFTFGVRAALLQRTSSPVRGRFKYQVWRRLHHRTASKVSRVLTSYKNDANNVGSFTVAVTETWTVQTCIGSGW